LTHKSNAEELINEIPPIEVDDNIAICYGVSDYGWGHPTEYITLNTRNPEVPNICKYCGLRFVMKQHH
jgi:NADH dehydrogenase (ubiquinone) Fe-S protein 6